MAIQMDEEQEIRDQIKQICIPMWEKWMDKKIQDGDSNNLPAQIFAEVYSVKENSPIALMFLSYCAGLDDGIHLAEIMDQIAERKKKEQEENGK